MTRHSHRHDRQGPRWRRRKEARPEEIVHAALGVFADCGYAGARLDEVAARAGVSKGTLYLYFANKEELFKAVVRAEVTPHLAAAEAMAANNDWPTPVMIRAMLRFIAARVAGTPIARVIKLVIGESGNFPDIARFYRKEVIERGLALTRTLIERGIARGEFRDIEPDHAARLVIAPVLLAAIWHATFETGDGGDRLDIPAFIDAHAEVLLAGLARQEPEP